MRKFFLYSFIAYLFGGIVVTQFELNILPQSLEKKKHTLFYDYKGITHTISDKGLDSPPPVNIVQAAKLAGIKYLFITDLNQFENNQIRHGYTNDVMVFISPKVSYLDDHFLFYSRSKEHFINDLGHAHAIITDQLSNAKKSDSILVLAHPLKNTHDLKQVRKDIGIDGLEIINLRKMWQEMWKTEKLSFIWSLIIYPFNSHLALFRLIKFPNKELSLWDELSSKKQILGFLGNQTTSKIFRWNDLEFRFPTYFQSFSFASNHLLIRSELTGNFERDSSKIFEALKSGQFYMAFDTLGSTYGFATYIKQGEKIFTLGSSIALNDNTFIHVDLPEMPTVPFEVALFCDGKKVEANNQKQSIWKIKKPGVYRVVVRVIPTLPLPDGKRWFPWIYTNTFKVI